MSVCACIYTCVCVWIPDTRTSLEHILNRRSSKSSQVELQSSVVCVQIRYWVLQFLLSPQTLRIYFSLYLGGILSFMKKCFKVWYYFWLRCFLIYFLKILFILERGREGERKRNISVLLPLTCPPLGTWPATQARALTGNWTCNLWFTVQPSIYWATSSRAGQGIFF